MHTGNVPYTACLNHVLHWSNSKVEPVNVSPENQVEKTEEDLIKDFKSGDVKEEKELSMKDIEQSPEAATARKIDGVCSKGEYEVCVKA